MSMSRRPVSYAEIQDAAFSGGADLVGVVSTEELLQAGTLAQKGLFKKARSAVILAAAHARGALDGTRSVHAKQFDTLFTYRQVERASHHLVRLLEGAGHQSLAVPAFIPLDMSASKQGMVGDLDLRSAGIEAGIGFRGRNGLLVTERFGPRVRLGAVLTVAELSPTGRIDATCPEGCRLCIDACPPGALTGSSIDKRSCGRVLFAYGLRRVIKLGRQLVQADPDGRLDLMKGFAVRELWQNFMSGNYYYCWACQSNCPLGRL